MTVPSKTSTLEEYIASAPSDELNHYNMSIIEYASNIEYPIEELVNDYLSELMQLTVSVQLNTTEYYEYLYNPSKLSYNIYGSDCFDYLILKLNNMVQDYEFDKNPILLIHSEKLFNTLSTIYSSELDYLSMNRTKIKKLEKQS